MSPSPSNPLDAFRDLAGTWKGSGIQADGEPFLATLQVRGALAGRGVGLAFEARTESKELTHAEEIVVVPNTPAHQPPIGIYVGSETPGINMQATLADGDIVLDTGKGEGREAFRIHYRVESDGGLQIVWYWPGESGELCDQHRVTLTRG
jgi:hypothetical protein